LSVGHNTYFEQPGYILSRFGSRRGFIRTIKHYFLYLLGRYHDYYDIDWHSVERLVFICKGNICRSAFAEAVAASIGIEAISCGLDTIEHAPANSNAIDEAKQLGYDLSQHQTTPFMYVVLRKTDLIIAMEPWQAEFLRRHLTRMHQYTLLGLWSKPARPHIQDPYGTSHAYFNGCFGYIEKSVRELVKRIKNEAGG